MTTYAIPGIKSPEQIIAETFESTVPQMKGRSRLREHVEARQVAMWYYVNMNGFGHSLTARKFNRDHSTVTYSVGQVDNLRRTDKVFNRKFSECMSKIDYVKNYTLARTTNE